MGLLYKELPKYKGWPKYKRWPKYRRWPKYKEPSIRATTCTEDYYLY